MKRKPLWLVETGGCPKRHMDAGYCRIAMPQQIPHYA